MKPGQCSTECEHIRSFLRGFDGKIILAPYNAKNRVATCALKPGIELRLRYCAVCWRDEEN